MKNLMKSGKEHFPLDLLRSLPGIRNAWMYRGRVYLAVLRKESYLVKKYFNGHFFPVEDMAGTRTFCSRFQTAAAMAKQEEARNYRVTKPIVQRQYRYLKTSASHLATDPDLEYYSEGSTYDRKCEIEDENDEFNPSDLKVPAGYVGHVYRDEFY